MAGLLQAPKYHIFVIGKYQDQRFQQLKAAAEYIAVERPEVQTTVEAYFETQYEQRLKELIAEYGSSFKQSKPSGPLIFAETDDDQVLYFSTDKRFFDWAQKRFKYEDNSSLVIYRQRGGKALAAAKRGTGRSYVTLTLQIGSEAAESVIIELFDEECPMMTKNFLDLLAMNNFKDHKVHRVKPGAWLQAGDLTNGSGLNSVAANGEMLRDESFHFRHDRAGLVGMAKHGKDLNGSQFYITARPLPFLDGQFVIFGRVIGGMRAVHRTCKVPTANERPLSDVLVNVKPEETQVGSIQAKMDQEEEMAATKLQSISRGRKARREVEAKKEAPQVHQVSKDDLAR